MRCGTVTYKGRKQRELWQPTWGLFIAADGARGVVHGLWGVREAGSHCDKGNDINNRSRTSRICSSLSRDPYRGLSYLVNTSPFPPQEVHQQMDKGVTQLSFKGVSDEYHHRWCIRQRRCSWSSVCTSRIDLSIVRRQCSLNCNPSDVSNTGSTI